MVEVSPCFQLKSLTDYTVNLFDEDDVLSNTFALVAGMDYFHFSDDEMDIVFNNIDDFTFIFCIGIAAYPFKTNTQAL